MASVDFDGPQNPLAKKCCTLFRVVGFIRDFHGTKRHRVFENLHAGGGVGCFIDRPFSAFAAVLRPTGWPASASELAQDASRGHAKEVSPSES